MLENPSDDSRIVNGGHQTHPASAGRARQDVDGERLDRFLRPGSAHENPGTDRGDHAVRGIRPRHTVAAAVHDDGTKVIRDDPGDGAPPVLGRRYAPTSIGTPLAQ